MNTSADAAEQIVRMTLNGVEVAAKITGSGAKNLAVFLYAAMKDQKKTKGKIRLASMLRSGKELKIFAVQGRDLQKFSQEARRYGVLYCALREKNSGDGLVDIMVRAEDAGKINRIVERFRLATVNTAEIRTEIERSRNLDGKDKEGQDSADQLLEELTNPSKAKTEKSRPSEPISGITERTGPDRSGRAAIFEPEKPSVREELNKIRTWGGQKSPDHFRPSRKKMKKAKEKIL